MAPASTAAAPPPPRTLNVHKFAESRAAELQSLHSIVADRLNNDFRIRRDKRRRTTGHKPTKNRRPSKRRKVDAGATSKEKEGDARGEKAEEKRVMSRRARRRMELRANPNSGFVTSGDGTKRLRTHLWHAKRFTMVKRWGFYLPLGVHGRGKGSRALLKRFKSGALIHDASYCLPIELEGPEDSIFGIMRMVLLPSPSRSEDASVNPSNHQIAYGVRYGNALLCHVDAPLPKLIAPVIYMWRPLSRENNCPGSNQDVKANSFGNSSKDKSTMLTRKLWIWIHAAAFIEGLNLLNDICQKQVQQFGTVSCSSLEGRIAKLDIMGPKSVEVLKKILIPLTESCSVSDESVLDQSCHAASSDSRILKSDLLNQVEQLPSYGILSFKVHDPRDRESSSTQTKLTNDDPCTSLKDNSESGNILHCNISSSKVPSHDKNLFLSMWLKAETDAVFLSESKSLWDCSESLYPPLPEDVLCKERHRQRLETFFLESGDDRVEAISDHDFCRFCSILLLKHAEHENFHLGWSIILPLCWIKAFWISLVSHGAYPIGLREKRWIACNCGLPSFPFDFPDCRAYSNLMADEAVAFERKAELRPLAMRPSRIPIPPPWNCISLTTQKGRNFFTGYKTSDDGQISVGSAQQSSMVYSDLEDIPLSSDSQASTFPGFIPRTSKLLDLFLEKIGFGNMLSVPKIQRVEMGTLGRCNNSVLVNKELCFVRILLRAYKEGTFEEGAVVCAPLPTDLSQWTTRSDEDEEQETFQIPQPLASTYFTEKESGKWELNVPEDTSLMHVFRWPIGFVSTGFARGSSKPTAEALCEARLLGILRDQQSHETHTTPSDIYLLVRNMRSTVYRRALATVVLEKQNEDLEFM